MLLGIAKIKIFYTTMALKQIQLEIKSSKTFASFQGACRFTLKNCHEKKLYKNDRSFC